MCLGRVAGQGRQRIATVRVLRFQPMQQRLFKQRDGLLVDGPVVLAGFSRNELLDDKGDALDEQVVVQIQAPMAVG